MAVDVVDTGHDALLELVLRCHPDVAQDRSGELGEEALDEVEPGAVLGCERELEAAGRSSGKPSSGWAFVLIVTREGRVDADLAAAFFRTWTQFCRL